VKFRIAASGCLLLLVLAACASATPIGILGVGSAGVVDATLTSLYWTPDLSANVTGAPPGFVANGEVNSGTTLTCVGCPLNLTEGIEINNNTPLVAGSPLTNTFFLFAQHPNLVYSLTGVGPGSSNTDCAAASASVGGSCSINVGGTTSPVVLTFLGTNGTLVSVGLQGRASDAGTAGLPAGSTWAGAFSATIPNGAVPGFATTTPLTILQFFCGTDAVCSASEIANSPTLEVRSVSGSFNATATTVPEPSTITTIGIGVALVALSQIRRRRTRKA
jgi:hypothetical protein